MSARPVVPVSSLRAPRFSHSLGRGLAVLGSFSSELPVLGIADLADRLGMSRSTTHRYVSTLARLGFLEQLPSRRYRVGSRSSDFGEAALAATGLCEFALPALRVLREQTGYTPGLAVLDGAQALYVRRLASLLRGQAQGALAQRSGSRLPVHASAVGKVLLVCLAPRELGELLARTGLVRYTAGTITSRKRLVAELARVCGQGYAVSNQELERGVRAVAVPVRDQEGRTVAAVDLTVYGHALGVSGLRELLPVVQGAADCIADGLRPDVGVCER